MADTYTCSGSGVLAIITFAIRSLPRILYTYGFTESDKFLNKMNMVEVMLARI